MVPTGEEGDRPWMSGLRAIHAIVPGMINGWVALVERMSRFFGLARYTPGRMFSGAPWIVSHRPTSFRTDTSQSSATGWFQAALSPLRSRPYAHAPSKPACSTSAHHPLRDSHQGFEDRGAGKGRTWRGMLTKGWPSTARSTAYNPGAGKVICCRWKMKFRVAKWVSSGSAMSKAISRAGTTARPSASIRVN